MTSTELRAALDAATSERRLLEHPFYVAWAEGKLTTEDLAFYATQYWHQVDSFPGYLEGLAGRLPSGSVRDIVTENLADERDGDHPGLWMRFAEALGATDEVVSSTQAEPETRRCVESFGDGTSHRSVAFGLGMLYGYESQTPAVAATKLAGLRSFYGIEDPAAEYFELHGELDVAHTDGLADAIAQVAGDDDALKDAAAGAQAGAEAVWTLLDGVARVRNIA